MTRKWRVNRFDSRAGVFANYGSALQAEVTPYMDGSRAAGLVDYCVCGL
jgi:hypothetical protein